MNEIPPINSFHFPFKVNTFQFHHQGENENFILSDEQGAYYLLKRYRQDRKQRLDIQSEIELCQELTTKGIKTSEYISFGKDFIFHHDHRDYTLQKMIHGYQILKMDQEFYADLGKCYKKLHHLNLSHHIKSKLPQINLETTLAPYFDHLKDCQEINQELMAYFENWLHLIKKEMDFSDTSFIHFDLHEGNIIYQNQDIYLIDWEECGLGSKNLDIAVSANRLLRDQRLNLLKSLLSNYGSVDKTQLQYAIVFKLLYLACFVAKFTDLEIKGGRLKLYERYRSYIEYVWSHSVFK